MEKTLLTTFLMSLSVCHMLARAITDISESYTNQIQNDIYDNKVDDLPKIEAELIAKENALKAWKLLQQNNERTSSKISISPTVDEIIVLKGPPGPRGPPGAEITSDELIKQFKKMVKESAAKRAKKIILSQCPRCDVSSIDSGSLSSFYPGVEDRIRTINRSPVVFSARLTEDEGVHSGNSDILRPFQLTGSAYGSQRGVAADLGVDGTFVITRSGIYQFTATLNIHTGHKTDAFISKRDSYIQIMICPNDTCEPTNQYNNVVVPQYRYSLETRQRYFTVQFTAQMQLKKDDFIRIYILNKSRRNITVQRDSMMTGILLSV